MKKLYTFFFFFVFLAVTSYSGAQISKSADAGTAIEIKNNLNENKLILKIPNITQDEVEQYAQYYVKSFSVEIEDKDSVVFNLTENSPNNNRVILRFLSAINIQQIAVSQKDFSLADFYEAFLN